MTIRVCIVDDHTIVRDGLFAILRGHPDILVVGTLPNARMAVNQVKNLQPDVILMDISMPEFNGIDATRMILEFYPQVRIIILSMLGTAEHIYRALQAGVSGYLLKESAGREVVDAVLAVAAGQKYFSQSVTKILVDGYLQQRLQKPEKSPLESLSQREFEIMLLVMEGKSSADIGELLKLSPKTIESYRSRLMQKLGVTDMTELIKFGFQNGLLPLP